MRKNTDWKICLLAVAALTLAAGPSVEHAMAYFTSYTAASGTKTIDMGFTTTEPKEEVDNEGKHVTIENTGAYDCFVRVKVISDVGVSFTDRGGWKDGGDGYWYYPEVLGAGKSTGELLVSYELPAAQEKEDVNIIVLQECTPVIYDEDGTPAPDWENVIHPEMVQ